jgi:uncharacterized protein YndB with AHSA1/START domain
VADSGIESGAPAERLWQLVARPDQWSKWSPHVRGAEGLGSPEVEQGEKGSVVLRGGIKVPAEITEVVPGRSWTWKVGGIVVHHRVTPTPGGSRLEMPVESTGLPWNVAAAFYSPLVGAIARRLVQVAEREYP